MNKKASFEELAQFVVGNAAPAPAPGAAPGPAVQAAQPPQAPPRQLVPSRPTGSNGNNVAPRERKLTCYLSYELHRKLKIRSAESSRTVEDLVSDALSSYLTR